MRKVKITRQKYREVRRAYVVRSENLKVTDDLEEYGLYGTITFVPTR